MRIPLLLASALVAGLILLMWSLARDGDRENEITVSAAILEANAPASVTVSGIASSEHGTLDHQVRVRWEGEDPRRLDDARFTHHIEGDRGDLITAGRHCGADWDEGRSIVIQPCLLDLKVVILQPGETHAYPVSIYPEVGPLRLGPGRYVVDEVIHWWPVDDFGVEPFQRSEGSFTIRLTYEVR